MRTYLLCTLACSAAAFNIASRREVLKATVVTVGLAPLAPLPAYAKGKRSLELAASEAEEKARIAQVTGLKAGAAGKGLRGDASAEFDKSDTVQYNRDKNGGIARDANGNKIARADRNRPPEELGLKQWNGY